VLFWAPVLVSLASSLLPTRLVCALLTCFALCVSTNAFAQERAATPDLRRARELDQQGGRAFKDGRFKDAITFFGEAFRFGAPPVELWNIAKCHLKLDEPEAAEESFRQFLAQPDLTAQDRADATQELGELRGRPSTLAIDSDPSGATFTIDNAAAARGTTPGSIDIPPGTHHVHVEKEKVGAYDVEVNARLGRALIVQGRLAQNSGSVTSNGPGSESGAPAKPIGLVFSEDFGFFASKLGSYADNVRPVLHLAARYMFKDVGIVGFSGGFRFDVTDDGWLAEPISVPPGANIPACAIQMNYSGTELAGFLVGGIQAHVHKRVQLGGDIGIGLADFEGSPSGGQVSSYDCNPSYGLRPAFHIGTEASFVLTPNGPVHVRALIEPLVFQAHGAFAGATEEASGLWWRIGSAIGVAVDL
jgi:hypothetical protein